MTAAELAPSSDIPPNLEILRKGAHIYMVDDHESSHRMVKMLLGESFPGIIAGELDPQKALKIIPDLCSRGEIDVLVLGLDGSKYSGTRLLAGMTQGKHAVPTVFLFGGQGMEEASLLLSALCSAENKQRASNSQVPQSLIGSMLTFVSKEDAVQDPNIFKRAVDAMLIASQDKQFDLETLEVVLIEQAMCHPVLDPKRRAVFSLASDAFLTNILAANIICQQLSDLKVTLGSYPNLIVYINNLLSHLSFNIEYYGYYGLREQITDMDSWIRVRHEILGSNGLATAAAIVSAFEDKYQITDTTAGPVGNLQEIFGRVRQLYERMCKDCVLINAECASMFENGFWLEKYIHDFIGVRLVVHGLTKQKSLTKKSTPEIQGSAVALHQALDIAVTNAIHAVSERENPNISVDCGIVAPGEMTPDVAHHFAEKEYGEEDVIVRVSVSDNGPGVPDHILSAWRNHESFISTKTGIEAQGLTLMRDGIEGFNDGMVTIDTSSEGTKVTFYFGAKPKEIISHQ
jgi:hypothetical protein